MPNKKRAATAAPYISILIGDTLVSDPEHLQDPVSADTPITIMQGLSLRLA